MTRITLIVDDNIPSTIQASVTIERNTVIDIGDTTSGKGIVGLVESITIEEVEKPPTRTVITGWVSTKDLTPDLDLRPSTYLKDTKP